MLAQAYLERAVSQVKYSLRVLFSEISQASSLVDLSLRTIERRKENLELLKIKYKSGLESKSALLETEAALKSAMWRHETYLKNLRLARRKLNLLLGKPAPAQDYEVKISSVPDNFKDCGFENKIRGHYEYRIALLNKEIARKNYEKAADEILPRITADAYYGYSGADWPSFKSSRKAGASLSVPLFSSGRIKAQKKAAALELESADLQLKNLSEDLYIKAEDACGDLRQALGYVGVAETALEAARLRAWLVRKQYLSGQTSYFEWRSVEDSLIEAETAMVQAESSAYSAYAAFLKSVGE